MKRFFVLTLLLCCFQICLAQDATLGAVKQRYLNQQVVIDGTVMEVLTKNLLNWHGAKRIGNRYEKDGDIYGLAASYKGKSATVIAVQLVHPANVVNALGESVSEDRTVNPYIDLVVKFDDGQLAILRGYPITIANDVPLLSSRQDLLQEINSKLPTVIGKTLYAVGFSHLYSVDASLEDMTGIAAKAKEIPLTNIPLLAPLHIVSAKYLEQASGVVIKLKAEDDKEFLTFTANDEIERISHDGKVDFLAQISGSLLSIFPSYMSPAEITAIKGKKIFRGMSKTGVQYILGFATKENDWGRGGKQLIFGDNVVLIYLDSHDNVMDWQTLDK